MRQEGRGQPVRLGGPVFGDVSDPDRWVAQVRRLGYRAAYCPVDSRADGATVEAYAAAARAADLVIAEVGAWSNPISPDEATRRAAMARCQEQLALAERIGARCCVNIAGSRAEKWDGPHPENCSEETFDLIVESVRGILDVVRPTRTYYTLETMPWIFPDSPDSYRQLIRAIDRERFGVHLDPVNLISSPQRFFANGALIRECIETLGPFIRSCHAKDIALSPRFMVHLDEVRPGLGGLDYHTLLKCLARLDPDTPLMLEHQASEEEYGLAAEHIRSVAREIGVGL
jgi:sugar phosphate isomerase/epimerase